MYTCIYMYICIYMYVYPPASSGATGLRRGFASHKSLYKSTVTGPHQSSEVYGSQSSSYW